jgi:tetratricopeptide (TPR) repeat protein
MFRSLIHSGVREIRDVLSRRRKACLSIGLLCCLLLALWAGVRIWAARTFAAAEKAWQEERLDDARAYLESSARFYPLRSHLFAARIERLVGNYTAAENHLKKCKSIEGVTSRLQLEWVLLRALQGELTGLETALWKSIKDDEANAPLILEALAICYLREFRYRTAIYCLDKLLERDPDSLRILDWRSWAWEKVDNKEGLFQDCRRALELCPDLWKVRLRLARALLMDGNPPAATEHIRILQNEHPDVPEVRLALARWQMLSGKTEEARQTLDGLLSAEPEFSSALAFRGKIEEDPVRQEKLFRRALKADPLLNEAWYGLYNCLRLQHREPEAAQAKARLEKNRKQLRRLKDTFEELERKPSAGLLAEIGETYLDLGIPENARRFFGKALELDAGNRRAREMVTSLGQPDSGKAQKQSEK